MPIAIIAPMDVDKFLRTKLDERCTSMQQAFRKVDVSNNGVITAADFEQVLRSFGLRVTRQGLAALMDKYDHNSDGFVSYEEVRGQRSAGQTSEVRGPNCTACMQIG